MATSDLLDLSGKVIVITGGAQGIGEATAELCAARGASVVIVDYNAEVGTKTATRLSEGSQHVDFVATDVRDAEQVKAVFDFVQQKYQRLDGLVCGAGVLIGPWLQPEEFPIEDFERTLDINMKGAFLCSKYAAPMLEASGKGVMILIASIAGVSAASSSLAYGASKGGVNGLGMTLESHLRPRGIRVNVLCPGNIVTAMKLSVEIAAATREGRSVDEAIKQAEQNYGVPAGVARMIAFMLTEEADYLRGALFTR